MIWWQKEFLLQFKLALLLFIHVCVFQACADAGHLEVCAGWLRGSVFGERVVRLAGELCAVGLKGSPSVPSALDHHNHCWRLISLALSQQHDDGKHTQTECTLSN